MISRLISFGLAVSLVCCLCGTSALGKDGSDVKEPADKPPVVRNEDTKRNEKLKADMEKLVADAKAGKLKMPAQQFPQPRRNNLSTGAKIAIIAGIGAAIFLIIMFASLADDDS